MADKVEKENYSELPPSYSETVGVSSSTAGRDRDTAGHDRVEKGNVMFNKDDESLPYAYLHPQLLEKLRWVCNFDADLRVVSMFTHGKEENICYLDDRITLEQFKQLDPEQQKDCYILRTNEELWNRQTPEQILEHVENGLPGIPSNIFRELPDEKKKEMYARGLENALHDRNELVKAGWIKWKMPEIEFTYPGEKDARPLDRKTKRKIARKLKKEAKQK